MDEVNLTYMKGFEHKCLDHGFVKLVDWMGDDQRVCDSARVSFGADAEVKTLKENEGLIDYLIRNRHTSPLEMVEFAFEIKLPIFVMRQIVRHRTANLNEISGRYVELPEEFYIPEDFHIQSKNNKQGRTDEILKGSDLLKSHYIGNMNEMFGLYKEAMSQGVSKEEARILLPLATYTRVMWKMDLHNLFHFLSLRLDQHAQFEVRVYAQAILRLITPIVPLCVKAWEFNVFRGAHLNADEKNLFTRLLEINSQTEHLHPGLNERQLRILMEKLG